MLFWYTNGEARQAYRRRVHTRGDCYVLRGGTGRSPTSDIVADLNVPEGLTPCHVCWPMHHKNVFKPYCELCRSFRACPHNGGEPVRTRRGVTYVWPENVRFHEPLVVRRN